MPTVISLSEFNRNQTEAIARLKEDGKPMYLTRNGRAAVVVMDADAFDRTMRAREELRQSEMETYAGLLRGYRDIQEGRVMILEDANARIRSTREWQ